MKYILLFLSLFALSCKYNVSSPVATLKDYTANSGIVYYVSASSSAEEIETVLRKNKHSLGKYKIIVTNDNNHSTAILTNIKTALDRNPSFNNAEVDLTKTSISNVPANIFQNTVNMSGITLPDSITNIESNAFAGCSSLNNIRFSSGLTNIGENAFLNCSSLSILILPDSLENISSNAFAGCSSLADLFLPASITNINDTAFNNCSQLINVEYLGDNTKMSNVKGAPFKSGANPSNLYLPSIDKDGKTTFLGKPWSDIKYKQHIPS